MESAETSHLLDQFWHAIQQALSSSWLTRKAMRLQSQKERFPVQEWLEKLEALYSKVLKHSGLRTLTKRKSITMELLKVKESLGFAGRSKLVRSGLPEMEDPEGTRALRARLHLSGAAVSVTHAYEDSAPGERDSTDSTESRSSESEFNSIKASSSLEVDFTTFQIGNSSVQKLDDWRLHAVSDIESASDTMRHVDSKLDMSGVMPRELMSPEDLAAEEKIASLEEFRRYPEASIRVFEQFGDQKGELSQVFEKQLGKLSVDNSVESLCIEKTLKEVCFLNWVNCTSCLLICLGRGRVF
jgi:hypothetical protein